MGKSVYEFDSILNFLKSGRTQDELKLCLDVLTEFKECESDEERLLWSYESWVKLEQFERYLQVGAATKIKFGDLVRFRSTGRIEEVTDIEPTDEGVLINGVDESDVEFVNFDND